MNPSAARHGAGPKSTPALAGNRIFIRGVDTLALWTIN
jgi:hypothetical protein